MTQPPSVPQPPFSSHDDTDWILYTHPDQKVQFQYPAGWEVSIQDGDVFITSRDLEEGSSVKRAAPARIIVYKPQYFSSYSSLEEYIQAQDRNLGIKGSYGRVHLPDPAPGYQLLREVVHRPDGQMITFLYLSAKDRVITIVAYLGADQDLDIRLAQTLRFLLALTWLGDGTGIDLSPKLARVI